MIEQIFRYQKRILILESSIKSLQKFNLCTMDIRLKILDLKNRILKLTESFQEIIEDNNIIHV